MSFPDESHYNAVCLELATLKQTHEFTTNILRRQRDANADAIVQLSVKLMILEEQIKSQQIKIKNLSKERDTFLRIIETNASE